MGILLKDPKINVKLTQWSLQMNLKSFWLNKTKIKNQSTFKTIKRSFWIKTQEPNSKKTIDREMGLCNNV